MADQFLAEIRIFPFSFPPLGWAFCNGQLLPINQNAALFSLVGTFYGGDGRTTFALPNLQGMGPLDAGQGNGLTFRELGEIGGEPTVTLTLAQMPAHVHAINGSNAGGDQNSPAGGLWSIASAARGLKMYDPAPGTSPPMNAQAFSATGGNQAHDNMMPYLVLNYCIALQGIYPSRG
jgi:microcystin-dependent protein